MAKCKYKESCGYEFCLDDCCHEFEAAVETNADRIRAMSDEELSVFLWEFDKEETARTTEYVLERRKITEWLKQPAEGE